MYRPVAVSLVILVVSLFIVHALPTVYLEYAEVMEWTGSSWRSTYLVISENTLSFSTSSPLVVVRTDPASGKQPVKVLVDGAPYAPSRGAGVLWNTAVLRLDGSPHLVSVVFDQVPPRLPALMFFTVEGGKTDKPLNVSVPRLPGLSALGVKVVVVLKGENLGGVFDKPFFVLNSTSLVVMGEKITAVEAFLPFVNVSLSGGFVSSSYYYVYGYQSSLPAQVQPLPGIESYLFINSPAEVELPGNLVQGSPPKVHLLRLNKTTLSIPQANHLVRFTVTRPSLLCGAGTVSFRVVTPPSGVQLSDDTVRLSADNTTLLFRFFSGGVSLVDVVVTSPPPNLAISPPLYTLSFTLFDRSGGRVDNALFVLYSQGRVVASGAARVGEGAVCPLPPGDYTLVVYLAGKVIARENVRLSGDMQVPVLTNTTTVKVALIREGSGDVLRNYTLTLENQSLKYNATSTTGEASVEGVLPGVYELSVQISGVEVYRGKLEVTEAQNTFVLSIPVYTLRVQIIGALNQPIAGKEVQLEGDGVYKRVLSDEAGRADFGLLPPGNYRVKVGGKVFNVTLAADSFKLLQLDVVAEVAGVAVTVDHLEAALLVFLVLGVVLAVRKAVKSFKRRTEHIVEV